MFLDLQYLTPIASGIQGAGERFALNIPVPPNPALRGAAIALQASSLRVPAAAIEFSNPVVVVLD